MGNPVIHFEVVGRDGGKLQSFYGDLFGWKISTDNQMNYGMVDTGGAGGINGGIGATPDGNGHVTFYVQVDDLQATLEAAESMGGKTIMLPTDLPDVSIALFADPEGHTIGLVKT